MFGAPGIFTAIPTTAIGSMTGGICLEVETRGPYGVRRDGSKESYLRAQRVEISMFLKKDGAPGRARAALSMDYVDIPPVARRLSVNDARSTQPQLPSIQTSVKPVQSSATPAESTTSPAKTILNNLPSMLLASAAVVPNPGGFPGQPGSGNLVSTRDPLSIPTTTANFRRFVPKVGPIFWLQDRIEEILMWKKGWKVTTVWMAVYAFLCQSPFSRQVCFF